MSSMMRSAASSSTSRGQVAIKRETMPQRVTDDNSRASMSTPVESADEFGVVVKEERLTRIIRPIPEVEEWRIDNAMKPVSVPY